MRTLLLCSMLLYGFAHASEPAPAHTPEAAAKPVTVAPAHAPEAAAKPATPAPQVRPTPSYIRKPASHAAPSHSAKAKPHKKTEDHSGAVHWSYEGAGAPEKWAQLDPANILCTTGQQQSPIDVRTTYAMGLDPLQFQYQPTKLNIVNNGHTIQHNIDPGSFLLVGADRYQLLQFHFHTPSEEAVGGKRYPMVAHLVHKNDAGQLAVVAVFLTQGTSSHPLIEQLWEKLPEEHNSALTFDNKKYSATSILPHDRSYWTLMGSLTTPPCSEGVRWFILKTPIAISKKQLAQFQREFSMNARPIQPLNQRAILDAQ